MTSVAEIIRIYKNGDNIRMKIKRYLKKETIFNSPCESSTLNMWEVSRLSSTEIDLPLNSLIQKFVKLQINYWVTEEMRTFVIPLLH